MTLAVPRAAVIQRIAVLREPAPHTGLGQPSARIQGLGV